MEEIIDISVSQLTAWIKQKEYKNIRTFFDETNIVDGALLVDELATEDLLHLFKIVCFNIIVISITKLTFSIIFF